MKKEDSLETTAFGKTKQIEKVSTTCLRTRKLQQHHFIWGLDKHFYFSLVIILLYDLQSDKAL